MLQFVRSFSHMMAQETKGDFMPLPTDFEIKRRFMMFGRTRFKMAIGFIVGVLSLAQMFSGMDQAAACGQYMPGSVRLSSVNRCTRSASVALPPLAKTALADDSAESAVAISELRTWGPLAVDFLMKDPELRKSPRWPTVLDSVAQQKDASYSGLFWHTDLNDALAEARQSNKPILSLRLLGKLTDELSCANSRFFRTTLYPHGNVKELLSKEFVLHWQTVRAAPIITIDFGDGRKIQRTITGNSLHLVLDQQGRTIDVLPGLYAAESFVAELQLAGAAARKLTEVQDAEFLSQRGAYHNSRIQELARSWQERCSAAQLVDLRMGIDHPDEIWAKIAPMQGTPSVLDENTRRAVLERAAPAAEVAGRRALSKAVVESPQMALIRNVSRIINEDSVRNEYHLHVQIHNWFAAQRPVPEGDALVARVYSELFLSPLDDPWYGLSRPDVFSAIKNDGRIQTVAQNSGD
jgi:hypothetical protein